MAIFLYAIKHMVFVLSLFFVPASLQAAGLTSSTAVSLADVINPHPTMGDITLPMPCNMSMVFRPVEIPARNALADTAFPMGNEVGSQHGMEYYDRRFVGYISAPFTRNDMADSWKKALPPEKDLSLFWYIIGKYEVSEAQWHAVMDNVCPKEPFDKNAAKPKANISWYDMQAFLKTYNQWLLDHADAALPRFANDARNRGFLRLPTEAEWEYAARGGSRVPRETFNQEAFAPMAEGTSLRDYAVFRAGDAATVQESPLGIGSRKANPLGLHDMSGNVAELVQDSFRFSLGGRLHGSIGGHVRKGGGFMSIEQEIRPGSREEVALFNDRGPVHARDLGFRIVVSGINTPGGGRSEQLQKAWQSLGDTPNLVREHGSPLQEIDRLLAQTHDPTQKEELTRLRSLIKDNNIILDEQRSAAAESLIRTALYMSETVRNYGVRFNIAHQRVEEITLLLDKAKKRGQQEAEIKAYTTARSQFLDAGKAQLLALESAVNFYKTTLEESTAFTKDVIDHKFQVLGHELQQDDILSRNMRQNLELFGKHLQLFRAKRFDKLTQKQLIRDILPKNLQAGMDL